MRRFPVLTAAIALWSLFLFAADAVDARSESLRSTIIITVREKPQLDLLPDQPYQGMVKEPAIDQSHQDVTHSEERTYTFIGQL
jgi:hypothetical protein